MKEYQLKSAIELVGAFWPPDSPASLTTGMLSSQKGRLYFLPAPTFKKLSANELRDSLMSFGSQDTWPKISVLQGETRDGRCTLFDLIETENDGLLEASKSFEISAPRWKVFTAVFGLHLESDEAEVIDGAAYYISNIKSWLPRPGSFQMTEEGFVFKSPFKALQFFSFSSLALEAEVICEIFSRSGSRNDSIPRIRILPKTPKSLDWYWRIGPRLENFFSLFLGSSVSLKSIQLFQGEDAGWLVKKFQSRQEKINYQSSIRCQSNQVAAALANWFEMPEPRPVETIVLNTLRKSSLFIETEFLGLAQALEGFARLRFETKSKKFKLDDGIEQTYDLLSKDFALALLGERSQFVSQFLQTRNYFTHPAIRKGSAVIEGTRLFLFNQRLHALLRGVMLLDAGLPEPILREPLRYQGTRWKQI